MFIGCVMFNISFLLHLIDDLIVFVSRFKIRPTVCSIRFSEALFIAMECLKLLGSINFCILFLIKYKTQETLKVDG